MAGFLLGANSSSIEAALALARSNEERNNPVITSFEKEIDFIINSVWKKASKKSLTSEDDLRLSNSLFILWMNFQDKLPVDYFTLHLLEMADWLYNANLYHLARTHGYRRCLMNVNLQSSSSAETKSITQYVAECSNEPMVLAVLRSEIGDAMCLFYMTELEDPKLLHHLTRSTILSILSRLRVVSQAALTREDRYWLAHNAFLFTFSICRKMMLHGHVYQIIEHLLWCVICMESSVPLMANRYLQLRTHFYVAITQCYYHINHPVQAEVFARRALDKINELSLLEHQSSSEMSQASEYIFKESTIKLSVLIFKRSVFEIRRKVRVPFKFKYRPTVRDLLQLPSPRSSTEKLLFEMFPSDSGQFLAILETLTDTTRRPLQRTPPKPLADLENDVLMDVYLELFALGVDLSLKALRRDESPFISLLDSVVRDDRSAPSLEAIIQLVRLAFSYDQTDVVEILMEKVMNHIAESSDQQLVSKGKVLQLLLATNSLLAVRKRHIGSASSSGPSGGNSAGPVRNAFINEDTKNTNSTEEISDIMVKVAHFLYFTIESSPSLIQTDFDLLLDSLVLCWEVSKPVLSRVTSHDQQASKLFLKHSTGNQYWHLLVDLVSISRSLELWRADPLLHGELCLKLCYLFEAKADRKSILNSDDIEASFLLHDRSQLLECRDELQRGLHYIKQARVCLVGGRGSVGDPTTELEVLHAEYLYALTRVQVKLASTIPPPSFFESEGKLSSLKSKVAERKERQVQRDRLLSQLTSLDISVPDLQQLKEACGKNYYQLGTLSMVAATTSPDWNQSKRKKWIEESYNYLLQYQTHQVESSRVSSSSTNSSPSLPPPLLVGCTDTSMDFTPNAPPASLEDIAYYKLFGRGAAGSNVKVRLMDKDLPGLGIEVPADANCRLVVHGLQPNTEYVFAVAGYTSQGKLAGKSIGKTTRPFLAAYSLPLLSAWGYCSQSAFVTGVESIAMKASKILWNASVSDELSPCCHEEDAFQYHKLKVSSPITPTVSTHLRMLASSIFISSHFDSTKDNLVTTQLCAPGPLRPHQLKRIELVRQLMLSLDLAGMLNDPFLSLQVVVQVYSLLVPFLQHGIPNKAMVDVLLHCHAALTEVPEEILKSKQGEVTAAVHHMIAAIAYYVGKAMSSWTNSRPLFTAFTESSKSLLILTLFSDASSSFPNKLAITLGNSFLSSSHDPAITSYGTTSSPIPAKQKKDRKRKSRVRKKALLFTSQVPDEKKTIEYKSLEGFMMAHQQLLSLDDLDLGGGEDPVVLHAVIASQTSLLAYREVSKFRKRPQYLEMLVHLCVSTVRKGFSDRVMEWVVEAFQWLSKRNDILLTPRVTVPQHRNTSLHGRDIISKLRAGMLRSNAPTPIEAAPKNPPVKPDRTSPGNSPAPLPVVMVNQKPMSPQSTPATKASLAQTNTVQTSAPENTSLITRFPNKKSLSLNISQAVGMKITKEDLEAKSILIIITQLPQMWRIHRCRKRIRAVVAEELPWRSQANIILANCYLNHVLVRLREEVKKLEELEKKEKTPPSRDESGEGLRFEFTGVIIEGLIPVFPPSLAGLGSKSMTNNKFYALIKEREAKSSALGVPSLPNSSQILILEDIRSLMMSHQRAAILAARGNHWTLLQNVARSLWNAINSLMLVTSKCNAEVKTLNISAVYGMACRPLYYIADGLIRLLVEYGTPFRAQTSSLDVDPRFDDSNEVGVVFIQRVVFLGLHTLYIHQNWEKVITLAIRFDDATKHSWADQLVHIISSAQSKLSERISTHTIPRCKVEIKLEPAAHLDPGPKGYNVYKTVGHSLYRVLPELTDESQTENRIPIQEKESGNSDRLKCQLGLVRCRRYFQRYMAGIRRPDLIAHLGDPDSNAVGNSGGNRLVVDPLTKPQLPVIASAYDGVLKELQSCRLECEDLIPQAMNELGDVILLSGNNSLAGQWWLEGLSVLLKSKNPLISWRKLSTAAMKKYGLWGCLLGARMSAKLVKHVYASQLDIRLEYCLLAASLLKTALTFSLPYPTSDINFIQFNHTHMLAGGVVNLFPGVELFSDPFRCCPAHLLSTLRWCSEELVKRRYSTKALPILWFYHHIAIGACRSVKDIISAKILRLRSFTQLSLFNPALQQLQDILTGNGLPQDHTHQTLPFESSWVLPEYQTHLPVSDHNNSKILFYILDKPLKPQLETLYGPLITARLANARGNLYIALLQTSTLAHSVLSSNPSTILSDTFLKRHVTRLSTIEIKHQDTKLSVNTSPGNSPPTSRPSTRGSVIQPQHSCRKNKDNVKLSLVHSAESLLGTLIQFCSCQRKEGFEYLEVRIQALLGLAQLSLNLQHSITGYQLSLQAVRLLQSAEEEEESSRKSSKRGSLKELDPHLWLECTSMMIRCSVGLERVPGGERLFVEVEERCRECEENGDMEIMAEMEFSAAEHAMSMIPCQLQNAQQHSQLCVEVLNRLPELSCRGEMLFSKASLLLADTTCLQGTRAISSDDATQKGRKVIGKEMVGVFEGLTSLIRKQLKDIQPSAKHTNIYLPQRTLLASSLLRKGHTHVLLANREEEEEEEKRRDHLLKGMECFNEGSRLLYDSIHEDWCLLSEFMFAKAWCIGALDGNKRLEERISLLLKNGRMVAESGTNYRLASEVFLSLAELYNTYHKEEESHTLPQPGGSDVEVIKNPQLNSHAWSMVKLGLCVATAQQAFKVLISAMNDDAMMKSLPAKILADLPEFALLELCPPSETQDALTCTPTVLQINKLIPSKQCQQKEATDLNWFKIVNFYYRLLQRCYWQKVSIGLAGSEWGLTYHSLTQSTHTKAQSLLGFISAHFPRFRPCLIPPMPPSLSNQHKHKASNAYRSVMELLTARDTEISLVWHQPSLPPPTLSRPGLTRADTITGYFAMSTKAVLNYMKSDSGVETHVIHTSLKELSLVYEMWRELEMKVRDFLDSKEAHTPKSRSPSKLRRSEKMIQPSEDLMRGIAMAVNKTAILFHFKPRKLPRLEPHILSHLVGTMEPFHKGVFRGDPYYFFKEIFMLTSTD